MTLAPTARKPRVPPPEARLLVRDLEGLSPGAFDEDRLELALTNALGCRAAGATWVRHRFLPRGLSLVCLSAGVRVALHTWPERRALSLDVYGTCPELEAVLARCLEAVLL